MKKRLKSFYNKLKHNIKLNHKTINYVHDVSGIMRIVIFFDLIWCKIRYLVNTNEYRIFKYYRIGGNLRKTYLSKRIHNIFYKFNINENVLNIINNKEKFNIRFRNYINNDVKNIKEISFKGFEDYTSMHNEILCRSTSGSFLNSYKIYRLCDYRSFAYMSDSIINDKLLLIEPRIIQHRDLDQITNNMVLINIVSICNNKNVELLTSTIKFRDDNRIITGYVDINNGYLTGNLKDEHDNIYSYFYDYKLPSYDIIKNLTKVVALELSEIKEVEWTFTVDNMGEVHLMDANIWKDTTFTQQPEYLDDYVGLFPKFKECLKK